MRATSVYEFARATYHSPPSNRFVEASVSPVRCGCHSRRYRKNLAERIGIEPTSVQRLQDRQSLVLNARRRNCYYLSFLIARTIWSKSGQSPESSLEWRSLPLARISKAPPLEGMSVSDLMRSPSSRILVAKLTAFGV